MNLIRKFKKAILKEPQSILVEPFQNSLKWIHENTLPQQGIKVSSEKSYPYLEVTGYLIPTLLRAGEPQLAHQYAEFLTYMQRPNGSIVGADGKEYIFDTAQVLRGYIAAHNDGGICREQIELAANFIASQITKEGQLPVTYDEEIPEVVHVFCLEPLKRAAELLSNEDLLQASQKTNYYYKKRLQLLMTNHLTHFMAYGVEGFIEIGLHDEMRHFLKDYFEENLRYGLPPAFKGAQWTCLVGNAQLAKCAYLLGLSGTRRSDSVSVN